MNKYTKIINDKVIIRSLNNIIIYKDGKQVINPSEKMILDDGWIKYIPQSSSKKETLDDVINSVLQDLDRYDSSNQVNICYIIFKGTSIPYWADKTERSVLKTALQDSISQGRTYYRLDLRDVEISLNIECENLLKILSSLEVYAIDCYNKTTDHIFAIKSLKTIEEVKSYDYTKGYPEKLSFNF